MWNRHRFNNHEREFGPDYARSKFVEINMEKVKTEAQQMKSDLAEVTLCNFMPNKLNELGSGIVLYFWLLRKLRFMFYISFILTLPTFICSLLAKGEASDIDIGFYSTTIGKFALTIVNYTTDGEPVKKLLFGDTEINGMGIANMVSYLDLIASIIMLLMSYNMLYESYQIADEIDDTTITLDDYAVAVKGLPKDATEQEVFEHFNKLYSLDTDFHPENRPILGHDSFDRGVIVDPDDPENAKAPIEQKKIGPDGKYVGALTVFPSEYYISNFGKYKGSWIHDVTLVHQSREWILLYKSNTTLLTNIRRCRAQIVAFKEREQKESYHGALMSLSSLLIKRDKVIKKGEALCNTAQDVVGAIVIFANEESRYRCLEEYKDFNTFGMLPDYLKFKGEHQLTVTQAYHPTDYLWEYYDEKRLMLCGLRLMTAIVTIILLAIGISISAVGDSLSKNYQNQVPTKDTCNSYLPFRYIQESKQLTAPLLRGNDSLDAQCRNEFGEGWNYIYYTLNETIGSKTDPCNSPCSSDNVDTQNDIFICVSPCGGSRKCRYYANANFGCYCSEYITQVMNEYGWFDSLGKLIDSESFCYSHTSNYAKGLIVSNVFSVVVLGMNMAIQYVINFIIHYERHHLVSFEIGACAFKIFLAQFINTAIIILITRSRGFPGGHKFFLTGIGLFEGTYADFTSDWYEYVGSSILLTMLLNIVTSQMMQFANAFVLKYVYRFLQKGSVFAYDLVELYAGAEFNVAARLPVVTTAAFVCWFYSGGMPLLFFIVGTLFLVQYYVDVYNILYEFRKPPAYASFLLLDAINMVPYGVFLHMMVSIYMLSEPYLFYDSRDGRGIIQSVLGGGHVLNPNPPDVSVPLNEIGLQFGLRLSRSHIYPYFVIFMILGSFFIFYKLFARLIFRTLLYFKWVKYEVDDLEHLPPLAGIFEMQLFHPDHPYELPDYMKNEGYCLVETKSLEGYTRVVIRKKRQDGSFYTTMQFLREEDIETYRMRKNKKYGVIDSLIGDYEKFYGFKVLNTYEFDGVNREHGGRGGGGSKVHFGKYTDHLVKKAQLMEGGNEDGGNNRRFGRHKNDNTENDRGTSGEDKDRESGGKDQVVDSEDIHVVDKEAR